MTEADRLEALADAAVARGALGEAQRLWAQADKARDREASEQAQAFDWRGQVVARVAAAAAEVLP